MMDSVPFPQAKVIYTEVKFWVLKIKMFLLFLSLVILAMVINKNIYMKG
jgi:hypothetical protein